MNSGYTHEVLLPVELVSINLGLKKLQHGFASVKKHSRI